MSIFYNRARQGMEIPVYEDGEESRDFVHVNDDVEAIARALVADMPPGVLLNVGSGRPTSVVALARILIQAADLDAPVRVSGQFRLGDIRHCWADVSELWRLLGFIPHVTLEAGLARFCAWARMQPAYQDRLDEATSELRRKGLAS
jgi:dTDP-L-rhamnose 4-epimerase